MSGDKPDLLELFITYRSVLLDNDRDHSFFLSDEQRGMVIDALRLAQSAERSPEADLPLKVAPSAGLWIESPSTFLDGWGGKELPPSFFAYAERLYLAYKRLLQAGPAVTDEGYPGMAHDFETMRAALTELVTLKDLKDGFGEEPFGSHNARPMRAEYERRKPLAWQAARDALENLARPTVQHGEPK